MEENKSYPEYTSEPFRVYDLLCQSIAAKYEPMLAPYDIHVEAKANTVHVKFDGEGYGRKFNEMRQAAPYLEGILDACYRFSDK